MFTRMYFKFNYAGVPLDVPANGSLPYLTARQCRAKSIRLYSDGDNLRVLREGLISVPDDPYNDDGRPPGVLLTVKKPRFEFLGRTLYVEGLEQPNIVWAGLLLPPYDESRRKPKGVLWMNEQQKLDRHRMNELELHRQIIVFQ